MTDDDPRPGQPAETVSLHGMPPAPPGNGKGCQWIEGEPGDIRSRGFAIYCGQPVIQAGKPYCKAHWRRVWQLTPRRVRA